MATPRNRPSLSDAELTAKARALLKGLTSSGDSNESVPAPAPAAAVEVQQTPPRRSTVATVDRNLHPYGLPAIPMETRRVTSGCGVCGIVSPQIENRWTGTVGPRRVGTPGVWWGLPLIKGPSDKVSAELCRDCEGPWEKGEAVYYQTGGTPAWVGNAVTGRLRRLKRDDLIGDIPGDELVPLDHLPGFTWVGHVVAARTEGREDPTPPAVPFGFLDTSKRKKARTA